MKKYILKNGAALPGILAKEVSGYKIRFSNPRMHVVEVKCQDIDITAIITEAQLAEFLKISEIWCKDIFSKNTHDFAYNTKLYNASNHFNCMIWFRIFTQLSKASGVKYNINTFENEMIMDIDISFIKDGSEYSCVVSLTDEYIAKMEQEQEKRDAMPSYQQKWGDAPSGSM